MELWQKIEAYMQRKVDFNLEVILRAGTDYVPFIAEWNIIEKTQPTSIELDSILNPLKIFQEELAYILNDIRNVHLTYLNNLQIQNYQIGNYYFSLSDEFYTSIKTDIENAQGLGFTTVFSRDAKNSYFIISINEAESLLNQLETGRLKLWIHQKLSYFKKWAIEKPFKVCTTIEQLDQIQKNYTISVTQEEIETIYNMSPEQRNLFMEQTASNFIQN